ncbi:MAG: hypothetical protein AB1815_04255 [Bacillota bacterium]|jgi:hypothetical protein
MVTGVVIVTLVVTLLVVLSVRERMSLLMYREKSWDEIGEWKSSPLSRALTGLVGTAGGIYLSFVLLATFLEIKVPETVQLAGVSLEPMAALSIALAIVQPFALRLLDLGRRPGGL